MSSREEKKKNVIDVLNKARAMELTAIHQYMNQHYTLDDQDYGEFAANIKLIAIDEMRHAEAFAERIKELGGEPTVDKDATPEKGQDVEQAFSFDVDLEDNALDAYNEFADVCQQNGDTVSKKIFEDIINDEQDHLNYFDNIKSHIERLGNTYLAKIAGTPAATGLQPQGFSVNKNA